MDHLKHKKLQVTRIHTDFLFILFILGIVIYTVGLCSVPLDDMVMVTLIPIITGVGYVTVAIRRLEDSIEGLVNEVCKNEK